MTTPARRRLLPALAAGVTALAVTMTVAPSALAAGTASVRHVRPGHGPAGASVAITVTGFNDALPADVSFGSSAPVSTTDWTAPRTVTVDVPTDATTGTVTVTQGAVTASSPKSFTVTIPSRLRSSLSSTSVTWPQTVTVSGILRDSNGPVAHAWTHVQTRQRGAKKWRDIKGASARQTDGSGQVSWTVQPNQASDYRVTFAGNKSDGAAASHSTPTVKVSPRIRLRVGHDVPQYEPVTVTGDVAPALPGPVLIQQRSGGSWRTVARPHVRHGGFHATLHFTRMRTIHLRAIRHGDGSHALATSKSKVAHIVPRTLREGDSGPDVMRLQRRLKHLHYDVGTVSGSFGFDLLHAVTAFQKVQNIADDGVVGVSTWKAMNSPHRIKIRDPISGKNAVEVSLTHQVVLLEKNGKLWRIVDSSTAGGYYYTGSDGQSEKAVTPEGHFSIQYKIDGWHTSDLGRLYKPAYFTNTGYAIHGETEVPPYPASHGCVRITVPAMNRYYNFFYVGQPVYIYGNPPPGHE